MSKELVVFKYKITTAANIIREIIVTYMYAYFIIIIGGGPVERWFWVNFQSRGVLLILIIVGQGPTALTVGAGGDCMNIFSLVCYFSLLSPSLWETARYRLKYCLKGPLGQKQPTNQFIIIIQQQLNTPA